MRRVRRLVALLLAFAFLPSAVEAGTCVETMTVTVGGAAAAPAPVPSGDGGDSVHNARDARAAHHAHDGHHAPADAPAAPDDAPHSDHHGAPHDCCPPSAAVTHCVSAAGCIVAAPGTGVHATLTGGDAARVAALRTAAPAGFAPAPDTPPPRG